MKKFLIVVVCFMAMLTAFPGHSAASSYPGSVPCTEIPGGSTTICYPGYAAALAEAHVAVSPVNPSSVVLAVGHVPLLQVQIGREPSWLMKKLHLPLDASLFIYYQLGHVPKNSSFTDGTTPAYPKFVTVYEGSWAGDPSHRPEYSLDQASSCNYVDKPGPLLQRCWPGNWGVEISDKHRKMELIVYSNFPRATVNQIGMGLLRLLHAGK